MKTQVDKELAFNYFAGRATPLQKQLIDEWVQQPQQEELFYQWLDEWENQQLQYTAEVPHSLAQFQQFMARTTPLPFSASEPESYPLRGLPWRRLLVAASAVLGLGIVLWLFREPLLYRQYATGFGETRSLHLPDGSRATLNANSSLSVPRFGFRFHRREVKLAGEAIFSVTHTRDHKPFVVHTDNKLEVLVLGTEFSVFARPRGTQVVLTEGKVQVQYTPGEKPASQFIMKPGEVASLTPQGQLSVKSVPAPENHTAWARKQFVFDNTSLREISAMLQENYGVRVKISDAKLACQTVSGSFTAQTAEELLGALADILELHLVRQTDYILLSYPTE